MRSTLFIACMAFIAGCSPGVFSDIESDAPTRVLGASEGFRAGTFGSRLASVQAPFAGGIDASRVAAVGGPGSPFAVYGMWTAMAPDIALRWDGCDDPTECPASFGADVTGIPAFDGNGACFVFTSPDTAETRVLCEGEEGVTLLPNPSLADEEIGRSVAGVPEANNPVGVAFFGAPGASSGAGALYRLADAGTAHSPVTLPASLTLAAGDRFGSVMAADLVPAGVTITALTDAVVLAVTATGADRVYVLAVGGDGVGISAELLACLDGGEGFGGALAFGDSTGEGDPELFVGEALTAAGRTDAVFAYSLTSLTAEAGCASEDQGDDPPMETIACPVGLDVDCASSGFGSSIAIGDVDGDAVGDLLVGAPTAVVGGELDAGAAFLLSGSMEGLSAIGESSDVLVDSDPEAGARLGAAVAMVGSHLGVSAMERAEPVASAPGQGQLFFFLCSDLEIVASLADSRCLELD
jgi:hypothetical protein